MTAPTGEHSNEPQGGKPSIKGASTKGPSIEGPLIEGPLIRGLPIEALSDAIARVDDDGTLRPCNTRMRLLLERLSATFEAPITRLEQIPVDVSGEGEVLVVGERSDSCRVVQHGDSRWLIATEIHSSSVGLGAELATKRLRTLGGLAGSIVHDLSNLLLAGVGVAETLKPYIKDEVEAKALDELKAGARHGSILGRALASLLRRSPREWQLVEVSHLIDNVVAIVRRNATGRGIKIVVSNEPCGSVRVFFDEAVQALLHGLLYCIEGGAKSLAVSGSSERSAIAGGRERSVARVRVTASPVAEAALLLATRLLNDDDGLLEALNRAPLHASGLTHSRMAVTRVGGEVACAHDGDSISIDFVWPISARREAGT